MFSECSFYEPQNTDFKILCISIHGYLRTFQNWTLHYLNKVEILRKKCLCVTRVCVKKTFKKDDDPSLCIHLKINNGNITIYIIRLNIAGSYDKPYPSLVKTWTVLLSLPPGTGLTPLFHT